MKTKMPISTISYNTPYFLDKILRQLLDIKAIDFYCYIKHKAEADECGRKDHIHLYIEPTQRIDSTILDEMFLEYVEDEDKNENDEDENKKLPLKCMPFRNSKFDDWCLYSIHDKSYCYAKGLVKKYSYRIDDINTNDKDFLSFKYGSIDQLKITPYSIIQEAIQNKLSFDDLVSTGRVPIQMLRNYQYAYESLATMMTTKDRQGEFVYLEEDETFDEMLERKDDERQLAYLEAQSEAYLKEVKKRNDKFRAYREKWYQLYGNA